MSEKPQVEGLKSATEKTKQIITLSTGVVAITVTFFDKFGMPVQNMPRELPWTLFVAWGFFGFAIVTAIWTLGAITGTLDALDRKANGLALKKSRNLRPLNW